MALHFGFLRCYESKDANLETRARAMFEALTEPQKKFFWESLPWLMMAVGVSALTPASLPIVASRIMWADPVWSKDIAGEGVNTDEAIMERIAARLTPYIGFTTNVSNDTDREFKDRWSRDLVPFTSRVNTRMRDELESLRKTGGCFVPV